MENTFIYQLLLAINLLAGCINLNKKESSQHRNNALIKVCAGCDKVYDSLKLKNGVEINFCKNDTIQFLEFITKDTCIKFWKTSVDIRKEVFCKKIYDFNDYFLIETICGNFCSNFVLFSKHNLIEKEAGTLLKANEKYQIVIGESPDEDSSILILDLLNNKKTNYKLSNNLNLEILERGFRILYYDTSSLKIQTLLPNKIWNLYKN